MIARGVMDGDKLRAIRMDGVTMPETTLRLDLMRMGHDEEGRPSWLSRMIALRDNIGPFGLVWLEMLLRAADMRASAAEAANPQA
jgi:CRISPR-associated endonuclease/helicase Cas3